MSIEKITNNPIVYHWIKEHPAFKECKIEKIFPKIGLSNFNIPIDVKMVDDILLTNLLNEIANEIYYNGGDATARNFYYFFAGGAIYNEIIRGFWKTGTLNLPRDFSNDGIILFKKGEGIFKIYNKIGEKSPLRKLETLPYYKRFSAQNVSGRYNLVFSSDGDGIWDILTMSMRGISSCQTWSADGTGYSSCLIGSILDPYTGVLFIEDPKSNKTVYGTKMVRRCLIRFLVREKNGKKEPFLFIDRIYPSSTDLFIELVKKELSARIDPSIPIETQTSLFADGIHRDGSAKCQPYIPYSEVSNKLRKYEKNNLYNTFDSRNTNYIMTYRDTFIRLSMDPKEAYTLPKEIQLEPGQAPRSTKSFNIWKKSSDKPFWKYLDKIRTDLKETRRPFDLNFHLDESKGTTISKLQCLSEKEKEKIKHYLQFDNNIYNLRHFFKSIENGKLDKKNLLQMYEKMKHFIHSDSKD